MPAPGTGTATITAGTAETGAFTTPGKAASTTGGHQVRNLSMGGSGPPGPSTTRIRTPTGVPGWSTTPTRTGTTITTATATDRGNQSTVPNLRTAGRDRAGQREAFGVCVLIVLELGRCSAAEDYKWQL